MNKATSPAMLASPLDRHSPLPLYEQIKRRVLGMILGWQQEDERFHTDNELSEQFGVSRMTVRQAVQELVDEGYLRRVPGLGTFVCAPKIDEQFTPAMDFLDQWAIKGRPLSLKVLHCSLDPAPAQVAADLRLPPDGKVWNILRLRTVQHVPISIDYRYIDAALVPEMQPSDISSGSLLDVIGRRVELAYGDLKIEAAAVREEHADYLGLLPGDPILTRHLVYCDTRDRPVMSGVSHYRADQVRYSVRIPLGQDGRQMTGVSESVEFLAQAGAVRQHRRE